jgi:hypothetical protein
MNGLPVRLITLVALLASGCAHQPARLARSEGSNLQHWVDSELAPYLVEQLGEHPRFKGEPVILVSLDGPDIQADIDGLTRSLRDQLMDNLLSEPGVRLPWQPRQQRPQHHRRLEQVNCARVHDADYYVGIEISRSATAEYRVAVRALDVRAGEWVSGFGKSWSGSLSPAELRALQERRSDESLRGLRVLPFSSGHPDLAASYLANNLSCLLRQQDEEDLVIYVAELQSDQAGLRTLLNLIGNNLSRYREVRVTERRKEANFVLRGDSHEIQAGLYQLWVVLQPKGSGEHLNGMDTATYIRLTPPGGDPVPKRLAERPRDPEPAITRLELVRRQNLRGNTDGCGESSAACPLLELNAGGAQRVFVFVHGPKDGISRLSAGACASSEATVTDHDATRSYRFPSARFSDSDWPTVYAVAVGNAQLARQFEGLLDVLPDACSNAAGMNPDRPGSRQWLDRLDRLIADNREHTAWTARRIP